MEINYNQDIAFEKRIHKRKKSKNERKSIRVICKENKKLMNKSWSLVCLGQLLLALLFKRTVGPHYVILFSNRLQNGFKCVQTLFPLYTILHHNYFYFAFLRGCFTRLIKKFSIVLKKESTNNINCLIFCLYWTLVK